VLACLLGTQISFAAPSSRALQKVADLQAQAQKKGWTFTVQYHDVMDRPVSQATGFKMQADWRKTAHFELPTFRGPNPPSFDWRAKAGLTPIKDQGGCGSCWAFGTVASLENAIKIFGNQTVSLSEQELVSCDTAYQGCGGGDFALDYLTNPGSALTSAFPYSASDERCKSGLTHSYKFKSWAFVGAQDENTQPTIDQVKAAIQQYGVVTTVVDATDSFMGYSSGVFNDCRTETASDANHMVAIVGWDDSTQSWIGRNSWGSGWGEEGYFNIKYGCNAFGSAVAYGVYQPATR
jgi:C1A family cysteine protease